MKLTNIVLPLNKLLLDPNNYRLDYEPEISHLADDEIPGAQEETLQKLEKEKIGELRESIIQNGFLEMDRLVVRKLNSEKYKGFYLVVEGNRRTAAYKGIIEDYIRGDLSISKSLIEKANSINVICIDGTQDEIDEFSAGLMGVRHVSGPKKWSGYQSARLIDDRHRAGDSFKQIGALLGISEIEAVRRFRNYRAFLQMKEDTVFGNKILQKHYTLLSEFLSPSRAARNWLGWVEDADNDIYEFTNKEHLQIVYNKITSNDGKKAEITNVNKAREFIDYIESDEHREQIEHGVRIEDLPPLHKSDVTRIKLLKDFIHYLNSLSDRVPSEDESSLIVEIDKLINNIKNR